jgi:hypothetical protein
VQCPWLLFVYVIRFRFGHSARKKHDKDESKRQNLNSEEKQVNKSAFVQSRLGFFAGMSVIEPTPKRRWWTIRTAYVRFRRMTRIMDIKKHTKNNNRNIMSDRMLRVMISDEEQIVLSAANSLHFQSETELEGDEASKAASLSIAVKAENATASGSTDNHDEELADHLAAKAVQISTNMWPGKRLGKELRKKALRTSIHGVEIRTLPEDHVLAGQTGLFAVNKFDQFSILGEYCGQVQKPGSEGGEYVASLERDWGDAAAEFRALSLDAQRFGNESRAINHFTNILPAPNVIMQCCYVDSLPRVMIVCKRDIQIGEEILLNYGDSYVEAFMK